jgi:hypothetical protein
MGRKELLLNCMTCEAFTEYTNLNDRDGNLSGMRVACDRCKRSATDDDIYMVDPYREFERAESGSLLNTPY